MEGKRIEAKKNWPEPSPFRFCQFLSTFHQFLSTFYLGLKQVSRTTHVNARNNHSQISQELVSIREMAEDAEVGNRTSYITRPAKDLPLDMAENVEVGGNGESGNDEMVKKIIF